MTLEDFFTLTEMKDGFSSLARVEELVAVMQKQKDCVSSNISDAARQWSATAGTLAATENRDCLDHFIQLNGLCFLNQWLQEAQKYTKDARDNAVEELINAILTALERLPIDGEKLTTTGIGTTVEQLHGHKTVNIQDRARILFDKWNIVMINDVSCKDLEKDGTCPTDQPNLSADSKMAEKGVCSDQALVIFPCEGGTGETSYAVQYTGTESHYSTVTRCSDSSQVDTTTNGKISISYQIMLTSSSNSAVGEAALGDNNLLGSYLVSNSCHENVSLTEESSVCPAVGLVSAGTCSSPMGRERDDDQCDVSVFKDPNDGVEEMEAEINTKESCPSNTIQEETHNTSSSSSLSASVPAQKLATEPALCNFDSKGSESSISESTEPQENSEFVDCGMTKHVITTKELNSVPCVTKGFQDLSSDRCILRKIDGLETSLQSKETVGAASDNKELGCDANLMLSRGVDLANPSNSSKVVESKATSEMDQKSVLGLEYEEIDALEVARQVAIEVEREVVDYREPFCSSPEVNSGETTVVHSPDFVEGKQDQSTVEDVYLLPTQKEISDSASSPKFNSIVLENLATKPEDEEILDSPKVTSVTLESDVQFDKNRCNFDLNEDIFTEELDCSMNPIPNIPVNVSAPIAVVATSKGALGLPVTPLHFEGKLGWRGSAATSAFRPASPRRIPDAEKTHSGLKQKPNFIGFDLNVAESEDALAVDTTLVKQVLPVSSGLPSRDSSMEVSSRREERLKLDLNRLGNEDASQYPSSHWRLHHQNEDQSLSSASSPCSKQPSMRDFDLNDNLSILDVAGSHDLDKTSSKASCTYESPKLDDPVFMIMGSRMAVERKDIADQAQQSFMGNGLNMEPMMHSRLMLPYPHMLPPRYRYNGIGTGPAMPIQQALYGPGSIPYHMIDSRGAAFIPQVLGSPPARPPFLMSIASAPLSLNGVGSSRPGLDLNSGMASVESGSREGGSLKQLFIQGHDDLLEGQARTSSQPSSSGMALKRKEPDSGWESFQLGYKQMTSWQ